MYPKIRNCEFAFKCPNDWDRLEPTDKQNTRHCSECRTTVYYCSDDREFIEHAILGHCVAKEYPSDDELAVVVMGMPTRSQMRAAGWEDDRKREMRRSASLETRKDSALKGLKYHPRECPGCGYPVPSYRARCEVCSFDIGIDRKHAL